MIFNMRVIYILYALFSQYKTTKNNYNITYKLKCIPIQIFVECAK